MEKRKNLCAQIPESLHNQARAEQEKLVLTLSQYVEMVLKEHFEEGEKTMEGKTRTLAFQIPEELFGRIKEHLKRTGLSQKDFVIGLIEQALMAEEVKNQGAMSEEVEGEEIRDMEAENHG
ncbi:4-oxalocrotonate tautomerase [Hungatella hathewayi]